MGHWSQPRSDIYNPKHEVTHLCEGGSDAKQTSRSPQPIYHLIHEQMQAPFQALKKNGANFCWSEECEITFQIWRGIWLHHPSYQKPSSGEILYLYLAISESAVSRALVREDKGVQKPVYYVSYSMNEPQNQVSKARRAGACSVHHLEEAQALLSSLPHHCPHRSSPEKGLGEPKSNQADIKMVIRAEVLWTQIRIKDTNQRLVLADFITDFTPSAIE